MISSRLRCFSASHVLRVRPVTRCIETIQRRNGRRLKDASTTSTSWTRTTFGWSSLASARASASIWDVPADGSELERDGPIQPVVAGRDHQAAGAAAEELLDDVALADAGRECAEHRGT
jgi:hypothetical protein